MSTTSHPQIDVEALWNRFLDSRTRMEAIRADLHQSRLRLEFNVQRSVELCRLLASQVDGHLHLARKARQSKPNSAACAICAGLAARRDRLFKAYSATIAMMNAAGVSTDADDCIRLQASANEAELDFRLAHADFQRHQDAHFDLSGS